MALLQEREREREAPVLYTVIFVRIIYLCMYFTLGWRENQMEAWRA